MKKIKCPCCGYYTIEAEGEIVVDICPVCFWQYDWVAQKYPSRIIGPNRESLNDAKRNYFECGAYSKGVLHLVRLPLPEEFPENKR